MGKLTETRHALSAVAKRMRSISFSQYAEDVLLSVTLLPSNSGFYVDVGAYHPSDGSNTYKLYLKGWSGITIEPNPEAEPLFRQVRPRDVHVVAGVAEQQGELAYHRFKDGKLNTFSSEQADIYHRNGSPSAGAVPIPCRPLQSIIDEHARGRAIDLLSIDCEGFDLTALQSLDLTQNRPTAILIEDFEAFEQLRLGRGDSKIQQHLRAAAYQPVGQALFSTLYVDATMLDQPRDAAFRLASVQFGAASNGDSSAI